MLIWALKIFLEKTPTKLQEKIQSESKTHKHDPNQIETREIFFYSTKSFKNAFDIFHLRSFTSRKKNLSSNFKPFEKENSIWIFQQRKKLSSTNFSYLSKERKKKSNIMTKNFEFEDTSAEYDVPRLHKKQGKN